MTSQEMLAHRIELRDRGTRTLAWYRQREKLLRKVAVDEHLTDADRLAALDELIALRWGIRELLGWLLYLDEMTRGKSPDEMAVAA